MSYHAYLSQVPRLTEGTNYIFRVYAENSVGPGPAEELMQAVAPKGLMGKICAVFVKEDGCRDCIAVDNSK